MWQVSLLMQASEIVVVHVIACRSLCAWLLQLCRMSEEKRKEFTNTVLAAEFGDLLEWRDKLYKDHFPQV